MDNKIYLLTDGCMWEINDETGNEHPHAVEVVDIETGAVRYVRSGSKIKLVDGLISDIRTQKTYKEGKETRAGAMPDNGQDMQKRDGRKKTS